MTPILPALPTSNAIAPVAMVAERTGVGIASSLQAASLNPVLVYLSQLRKGSRRTMRGALDAIAKIVSNGELDTLNFPWAELRYQHTQAIYTQLLERYSPNKLIAIYFSEAIEAGCEV